MQYSMKTKGTCSSAVSFDLTDGVVTNVSFQGGCNGNTTGVSRLCEGLRAEAIIKRLKGVQCGFRGTSCPDQLARALEQALKEESK